MNVAMHDRSAPRRAVVIHARDWDTRQADLVECRLTRCGFAIDVVDECHLDGSALDPLVENAGNVERNWDGWTTDHLPASRSTFVAAASQSMSLCSESQNGDRARVHHTSLVSRSPLG